MLRLTAVKKFRECAFNDLPVGTGPFKFAGRKKAEYIKFSANENYFRGRPLLDAFYYKIVPDNNVLPPGSWGFDHSLKPLPYNPDEALKLLAAAVLGLSLRK